MDLHGHRGVPKSQGQRLKALSECPKAESSSPTSQAEKSVEMPEARILVQQV